MPIAEFSVIFIMNQKVKNSGIGATFFTVSTLQTASLDG
jgi:peptide/nickel transport system substrate-binding protein